MKKQLLILTFLFCSISAFSQQKIRFPVWTFHQDSVTIYGLSVGLLSLGKPSVATNGVRFELLGGNILFLLGDPGGRSYDSATFNKIMAKQVEKINGINLSPLGGHACNCDVNGLHLYTVGSVVREVNGISLAGFASTSDRHRGLQISGAFNTTYDFTGLQIGLKNKNIITRGLQISLVNLTDRLAGLQIGMYNRTEKIKGLQIGLWNENGKKKLPIINW